MYARSVYSLVNKLRKKADSTVLHIDIAYLKLKVYKQVNNFHNDSKTFIYFYAFCSNAIISL